MNRTSRPSRLIHNVTLIVAGLTLALALYTIGTAHTWQGSGLAILAAIGALASLVWLFSRQPSRRP